MKRTHSVPVLLLCAALFFSGCGGAKTKSAPAPTAETAATATPAAEPTAAPTPTPLVQEDRKGFDEAANRVLSFAGVRFSVPEYLGEDDLSEKGDRLRVTSATVSDSGKVALVFLPAAVKWAQSDYEGNLDEVTRQVVSGLSGYTLNGAREITFAGGKGRLLDLTTDKNLPARLAFTFREDTGTFLEVMVVQDPAGNFDYFPDFERMIAAAEREEADTAGVTPEFKATMDRYEAFMDKCVDFMQNYNSMDAGQMMQYLSILSDYSKFAEEIDAIDEDSLSNADLAYYLEVTARVSAKLLKAAG